MVATQISWWPDMIIFRSTDAGATWTRIWDWAGYPSRTFRYTMNITSVPWLTLGANPQPPEVTPKLGWMNESFEIDPFNSQPDDVRHRRHHLRHEQPAPAGTPAGRSPSSRWWPAWRRPRSST